MPQFKFEANELTNVQLSHVSLVKRGAIRLPFRILKSEGDGDMINLSKIFKTEPKVPTVAAVLINKAANIETAKARLTKAGFQIETFDDTQDGIIIFPQVEALPDITPGENGVYIVKMDEQLSVILTGVEKAFEPINFDSTSFDEVLAQEGMRPGIHLSMDVLGATVSNILAKAEDRGEMVGDLTKALDEFRDHIVDMAQAVPENAFSVDFFKAAPDEDDKPAPAAETPPAETPAANAPVSEPPAETPPAEAPAGDPPIAAAPAAAGMSEVVGQMAALAKGIAALTVLTKETSTKVDAQGKRIDETAALAKSASEAANKISNTVRGDADDDPAPVTKGVVDTSNPPLMDTAFHKVH